MGIEPEKDLAVLKILPKKGMDLPPPIAVATPPFPFFSCHRLGSAIPENPTTVSISAFELRRSARQTL